MRKRMTGRVGVLVGVLLASGVAGVVAQPGCSPEAPRASAIRITSREQLIGGRRALGDVGDYKISNGIIHAIVQNVGYSRGFGAFGGSLIDVDLVRGGKRNASTGGAGNDYFTEMFPAFFLQAVEPSAVEIVADGSDGKAAIIRVSGHGGEFVSLLKPINDLVLAGGPRYQVDYILEPGKQYLRIETSVINESDSEIGYPLAVPFGFVTLLGEGQRLFVPGQGGYDMRFRLEEVFQRPSDLEALPGEVSSMVTTEGEGVSYALAADPEGANYFRHKPAFYPEAQRDSLLIPIAAGSFLGTFWGKPPSTLAPGKRYTYTGYLAVGGGTVASVQRVVYELKNKTVGKMAGVVREAGTGTELSGITVVAQDAAGNYVSSDRTQEGGVYSMPVPSGRYRVYAVDSVRTAAVTDYVDIRENGSGQLDVALERPAELSVKVLDRSGKAIPAKISVQGIHDQATNEPARKFLYNFRIGERMRQSDLEPDRAEEPSTRKYLEAVFFAPDGSAGKSIRPGQYTVFASRGIEYSLASADVKLEPGRRQSVTLVLDHLMPTPDWVSGDFHVHSIHSVDSGMLLPDRVASYAVEGVDYVVSTDHNFVSDFAPTIDGLKLNPWLKSSVGLELSTLEMGHFNAWPLALNPGAITHGSFNWFRRPPGQLFAGLRGLAKFGPERTIVQVNHPRNTIMGYFTAFNVDAYTGEPRPPTATFHLDQTPGPDGSPSPYHASSFSYDFDTLEIFNGKHLEHVQTYRVPADPGPGAAPTFTVPPVGSVLKDPDTGQPAWPGVLNDYYTLLAKRGRAYTAVGNSDSHSASAEAGLPRTYVWVGETANGSMQSLSEDAVTEGLRTQKAVVTNGPFVELWVNGHPIGSRVVSPGERVEIRVRIQAVPWVDVSEVVVKMGHAGQGEEPVELLRRAIPESQERVRYDETFNVDVPDGSFVVAEVSGKKSMWPVFTPYEIPSIQLNDAVGSLASSFGYRNKFGRYRPVEVHPVVPFAVTNPVWIDRVVRQRLVSSKKALPLGPSTPFKPRVIQDLRLLFGGLHGD